MDAQNPQLPTTTSPQEASSSSRKLEPKELVLVALNRLALHYWRPDFTPSQAKAVMGDYLEDLAHYGAERVEEACRRWRCDPANKFFPRPGEMLALIQPKSAPPVERHASQTYRAPRMIEHARKLPSVAEVLRRHGHASDAMQWDLRKS